MAGRFPIVVTSSEEDPSEDTHQSVAESGIESPPTHLRAMSDRTSDAYLVPPPTAPVVTPTPAPPVASISRVPVPRRTARICVRDFPKGPLAPRDKAPVTETEVPVVEPPQKRLRPSHLDWMPRVLREWRSLEGIPSTFEIGESSSSPPSAPLTGEPLELTVPTLVAVIYTVIRRSASQSRDVMELLSDASRTDMDMAMLHQRMDFVETHRQTDWQSLASTRARVAALERRARVSEIVAGVCVMTAALMVAVRMYLPWFH